MAGDSSSSSSPTKNNKAFEEALDDVHTRFILNLPDEELQSAPRIFFQLEQAWWFYDDFICDAAAAAAAAENKPQKKKGGEQLPRFKHMKPFSLAMFNFSPLLQPMIPQFEDMYTEFSNYKRSISTYGTILLNYDATKIILGRVYQGKKWMLPAGKVNQNESGKVAAARETYEETGFDPDCELGLTRVWAEKREMGEEVDELVESNFYNDLLEDDDDDNTELPWKELQDSDKLVYTENDSNKRRTCYVCRGVPENFPFEPVARKEVSEVSWHDLSDLPKQTFAVLPFLGQLRRWIKKDNRKRGIVDKSRAKSRSGSRPKQVPQSATPTLILAPKRNGGDNDDEEDGLTPFFSTDEKAPWEMDTTTDNDNVSNNDDDGKKKKKKKKEKQRNESRGKRSSPRATSRSSARAVSRGSASRDLIESALASDGDADRWTEDDMFKKNEQMLGRKITYDGNPHDFAEKGFSIENGEKEDPHHFRVVGGTFMNSNKGGTGTTSAPDTSKLQPLMNTRRSRAGSKGSNVSGLSGDDEGFNDEGFKPFFSSGGQAPWEQTVVGATDEVVQQVRRNAQPSSEGSSKGLAAFSKLRQGEEEKEVEQTVAASSIKSKNKKTPKRGVGASIHFLIGGKNRVLVTENEDGCWRLEGGRVAKKKTEGTSWLWAHEYDNRTATFDDDDVFMTDKQITAKSQSEKMSILPPTTTPTNSKVLYDDHMQSMKQWVQMLPQVEATKEFGDFRLDVSLVMNAMATSAQS